MSEWLELGGALACLVLANVALAMELVRMRRDFESDFESERAAPSWLEQPAAGSLRHEPIKSWDILCYVALADEARKEGKLWDN